METGIESRAMKFKLQRGGVRKSTRDKDAEELVKQIKGDEGQIVSRKLFQNKDSPVQKYQQKSNEMYQYHIANTLPFGDDSTRLMKNSLYFEYTGRMTAFIQELDRLKQQIVGDQSVYQHVIDDDIIARNQSLYAQAKSPTANQTDYLSFDEMERRLYITWYAEPIATSGDFRFEIPDEMKKALDDNLSNALREAKEELRGRLMGPMKALVDKLAVPIGEEGCVFRNTLVTNLTEMVDQLPHLNLDDDPEIEAVRQKLADIIKPYEGRENELRLFSGPRSKAKQDVEQLMKDLSGGWKV